ncbi:MAG: hemolysin III family protein [Bacteroidetes bacterium]|jgi:hemolysin III|nr:hemolysin III family protein [Bacteroidota bacterium]
MEGTVPARSARERAEAWANTLTHGVGLLLSLVGLGFILALALQGDGVHVVGGTVFGITLVLMYTASTLYHASVSSRRAKLQHLLHTLDHIAIYLLIAGTYTPFLLLYFDGGLLWTLLCLQWGIALAGAVFKLFFTGRFRVLSVLVYVAMGWMIVFAAKPLLEAAPVGCVAWMAAGGLCYTFGVVFYGWRQLPYNHAIWHLFVLAGSFCHYLAVVRYVLP